jgi:hypothetical protein
MMKWIVPGKPGVPGFCSGAVDWLPVFLFQGQELVWLRQRPGHLWRACGGWHDWRLLTGVPAGSGISRGTGRLTVLAWAVPVAWEGRPHGCAIAKRTESGIGMVFSLLRRVVEDAQGVSEYGVDESPRRFFFCVHRQGQDHDVRPKSFLG